MSETEILWGNGESLQQLFGQAVCELAAVEAPEIVLEIGPLLPITLVGDKTDDAYFDSLHIFF